MVFFPELPFTADFGVLLGVTELPLLALDNGRLDGVFDATIPSGLGDSLVFGTPELGDLVK